MAGGSRSSSRPGAGPGRGKPRVRSQSRVTPGTSPRRPPAPPETEESSSPPVRRRRQTSLTARAIAVAVVLLILTISYATSLRIYFSQSHEIAASKADIVERQQRIGELEDELIRWKDSHYVRTQARERLGWVIPGETGYKVVGADGKPLGGGAEITAEKAPQEPAPTAWWAKMWGSIEAADQPVPAKKKARAPKPITAKTTPNSSTPTPAPTPTSTPR